MDQPSFAERLKMFNAQPVMRIRKTKPPIAQHEIEADSSPLEQTERTQPGYFNLASNNRSPIKTDSVSSSSVPGVQKPPVPAPKPVIRKQNQSTSLEPPRTPQDIPAISAIRSGEIIPTNLNQSSVQPSGILRRERQEDNTSDSLHDSHDEILYSAFPAELKPNTGFKKSPVALPVSATLDKKQGLSSVLTPKLHEEFPSSVTSPNSSSSSTLKRKPPTPSPVDQHDRRDDTSIEPLSVSLDAILSSTAMFFEAENMIDDYQRKDPRTIIYPKMKGTMPKITTNEIDILQRYLNN